MQRANVADWIIELQRAMATTSLPECERPGMEAMLRHLRKLHERGVREVWTDTIVQTRPGERRRPGDPDHQ